MKYIVHYTAVFHNSLMLQELELPAGGEVQYLRHNEKSSFLQGNYTVVPSRETGGQLHTILTIFYFAGPHVQCLLIDLMMNLSLITWILGLMHVPKLFPFLLSFDRRQEVTLYICLFFFTIEIPCTFYFIISFTAIDFFSQLRKIAQTSSPCTSRLLYIFKHL